MKKAFVLACGAGAVAVGVVASWFLGGDGFASSSNLGPLGSTPASIQAPLPAGRFPASAMPSWASWGSTDGRSAAPASRPSVGAPTASLAGVEAHFRVSRDLKAFADELLAREARLTREERYFLAKALETCGFAMSMNDDLVEAGQRRRRDFIATLSPTDPEFDRRVAAFDASDDINRCRRFQGQTIAQSKIDALYQRAGDGGDPRAQARTLVAELSKNLAIPKNQFESARVVEQDDFQRIVSLLESRNAEAIVTVAQLLAEHRLIEQLRMGPNGETPNPASLVGAFTLVACDFQPSCTAFDREALQACAHAGYCSAGSYEELYANFLASPYAWSLASRYRTLIHTAIETRNWGLIGIPKLVGARARAPQ